MSTATVRRPSAATTSPPPPPLTLPSLLKSQPPPRPPGLTDPAHPTPGPLGAKIGIGRWKQSVGGWGRLGCKFGSSPRRRGWEGVRWEGLRAKDTRAARARRTVRTRTRAARAGAAAAAVADPVDPRGLWASTTISAKCAVLGATCSAAIHATSCTTCPAPHSQQCPTMTGAAPPVYLNAPPSFSLVQLRVHV